jgi:1-deoxy-D-xylulose-5-phosphate reductoisomerase
VLPFIEIVPTVQAVLSRHDVPSEVTIEDILAADDWARSCARELIEGTR